LFKEPRADRKKEVEQLLLSEQFSEVPEFYAQAALLGGSKLHEQ
jgi:hypothetical protein